MRNDFNIRIMKITYYVLGLAALLLASCGGKKEEKVEYVTLEQAEEEFSSTLNASDTTEVLSMGAAFMDSLKAGNVDYLLDNLYSFNEGNPQPISEDTRKNLKARFQAFPVLDYEIDYYAFSLPKLNDLKYRSFFGEKDANGNAPSMSLMFNPMKMENGWIFTLKEPEIPAKDATNAIDPRVIVDKRPAE